MKALLTLSLISILAGCTVSATGKNTHEIGKKNEPKPNRKTYIITYKKTRSGNLVMRSQPGSTVFFFQ
jgi:hypothetical protein